MSFYQTYDKTVTSDYIVQNLMADENGRENYTGDLARMLFPLAGELSADCNYGAIRSIAVVHPIIAWQLDLFIYLLLHWCCLNIGKM